MRLAALGAVPNNVGCDSDNLTLLERYNEIDNGGVEHQLQTKEPVFENGNYRLNFNGRVTIPSVKNFQLTTPEEIGEVLSVPVRESRR